MRDLFAVEPLRLRELIRAFWPALVGPELASRTSIISIEKGTLSIRVPDARWRYEIHRMQPELLARLRAIVGPLAPSRIGLTVARRSIEPAPSTPAAARRQPEPTAAPPSVVDAAAAIEDDDVRQAFLATAGRYLSGRSPQAKEER